MAVAGNSTGTTIAYRGNISRNRRHLSGKWHAANDYRSYLRGGSFSFNLTHINGRRVKSINTASVKSHPGTGPKIDESLGEGVDI